MSPDIIYLLKEATLPLKYSFKKIKRESESDHASRTDRHQWGQKNIK